MVAKNKVKPSHGDNNDIKYNKKQLNNNIFNSNTTTNELKIIKNKHGCGGGRIEKKYKKIKSNHSFGSKLRNNKVQDIDDHSNTNKNSETKKIFDKKTWRLKKYSKKYKLQQWEEKRKKQLLTEYYKQMKNEELLNSNSKIKKFDVNKIYNEYFDSDEERLTNPRINYVTNPNFNKETTIKQPYNDDNGDDAKGKETCVNDSKLLKIKKLSPYERAQREYERIQEEHKQKKEDILRQKAERDEALKKYKKNKMEKYKKLSKKNRKGQPIMKERMEMLLEKIQSTSV